MQIFARKPWHRPPKAQFDVELRINLLLQTALELATIQQPTRKQKIGAWGLGPGNLEDQDPLLTAKSDRRLTRVLWLVQVCSFIIVY